MDQQLRFLREMRRALHRIPEPGLEEVKTHGLLMDELAKLPLTRVETLAGTGIRALLMVPGAERTIAFRADMDALAVRERTGHDFPSQHPGFMHACGHDGHMAALLGFARWCCAHREALRVNAVFLFQPAEESVGGAQRMIAAGALKDPDVDEIYGFHILPDLPRGRIGLAAGPVMAQTVEMNLVIEGKSAHGAMPHRGVDAVVAAAQLVNELQTVVTRYVDPDQPALITVGRLEAGTRRNVLADRAVLECVVRTFSDPVFQGMKRRILAMLQGLESAYGVAARWEDFALYPVVDNHPVTTERLRAAAGAERCDPVAPMMIAEDFSFYQREVPGTFFFLGSREPGREAPLHADTFDFDEEILLTPLAVYGNLVTGGM